MSPADHYAALAATWPSATVAELRRYLGSKR